MWEIVLWTVGGVFVGIVINERANRWWLAKKLGIETRDINIQEIILKRLRRPAQIAEYDIMRKEPDEVTR